MNSNTTAETSFGKSSRGDTSSKARSKPQRHRVTAGYKVCKHTCVPGGCINAKTSKVLWVKEGHSCRRHACSAEMHPNCPVACPAHSSLSKSTDADGVRAPTNDEIYGTENNSDPNSMDVDAPPNIMDVDTLPKQEATSSREQSVPVAFSYPVRGPRVRRFHIVFIPDASMRIYNRTVAQNDLAFVESSLTSREYEDMKHLLRSIHFISTVKGKSNNSLVYKVVMQEWVGHPVIHSVSSNALRNYLLCYLSFKLFLAMCISRWQHEEHKDRGFDVSYMVWEEFFAAVMNPINHKELLARLSNVDCVIGGVDMSVFYL
jgi:hypothetical protein